MSTISMATWLVPEDSNLLAGLNIKKFTPHLRASVTFPRLAYIGLV